MEYKLDDASLKLVAIGRFNLFLGICAHHTLLCNNDGFALLLSLCVAYAASYPSSQPQVAIHAQHPLLHCSDVHIVR